MDALGSAIAEERKGGLRPATLVAKGPARLRASGFKAASNLRAKGAAAEGGYQPHSRANTQGLTLRPAEGRRIEAGEQ